MNLPRNFSDEAFVLKRTNYGEGDRLLTVFTKNHGKLFCIAKGARKSTSRKAPHIELFTHTKLYFASSSHYLVITQAETINNFQSLKNELASIRAAFHLNEILDQLCPEGETFTSVFTTLRSLFSSLDQPQQSQAHRQRLITNFQLDLLNYLGFGEPPKPTPSSVYAYVEEVLDKKLKAAKSLQ